MPSSRNGYNCTGPNNTRDGNGVSVCSYLTRGSGFDVAAVTNNPASGGSLACLVSLSNGPQSLASAYQGDSGIGITAGAGAGVLAGHAGTATWQPGVGGAAASVVVAAPGGAYKTIYSGLSTLSAAMDNPPPTVTAGQVLGQVGETGESPRFGVSMAVRRDMLARAGLGGRAGADTGPAGDALAAGALASAVDGSYYAVNPETFLSGRIPVQPEALRDNPAAFAGRADTSMTLPTTCAADPASIGRSSLASSGSGPSLDRGLAGIAGYRSGGLDFAAEEAAADRRGLFLDLARLRADSLRLSARSAGSADGLQSTLAHLVLLERDLRR